MTDLLTQLRDYGRQIKSDPMLSADAPLTVDVETRQPQTPRPPSRRWVWALIAAAVVFLAFLPQLLNRSSEEPVATTLPGSALDNGWVAFPMIGPDDDWDISLVGLDRTAFRAAGSDTDGLDQLCPAFSADGTRLAYGEAAYGEAEETWERGYSNGTLVVADVNGDGTLSEAFRVDMGLGSALPCATWSQDGQWIAAGVKEGGDSPTAGDIWLIPAVNGSPTVLEGAYVSQPPGDGTDMEWSPDGTELAVPGQEGIRLYSVAGGNWRTLDGTRGARTLTWSPDGTRIAYEYHVDDRPNELRVVDADGTRETLLAGDFEALHGIGPVWSPTGNQIVYMRQCATYQPTEGAGLRGCTEQHEVVLVTPEGDEVVLPNLQLPDGDQDNPFWFVSRVTWSPDGSQLLYRAQAGGDDALIAVPLDPRSAPVMLHEGGIAGYAEGYLLASQSWGRQAEPIPTATTTAPAPMAIEWEDDTYGLGGRGGKVTLSCPPGGMAFGVHGTDIYTSDSSPCTAAVHAGLIDFEDGGVVIIQMLPGQDSYVGTTANGVTSGSWGSWAGSFVFVDE